MGASDDLSGRGARRARGRFAEVESYLTGAPQRPLEVLGGADGSGAGEPPRSPAVQERADVLAYLDRRIANAAAIEASTAPGPATREIAGDRRRQMEVMRDEIAQGMHTGEAAVAAKLSKDSMARVRAELEGRGCGE